MSLVRAHRVPDAADTEFWKGALPGQRVLVWFEDDDVFHERVLLWPIGTTGTKRWMIGTPDYSEPDGSGIYEENMGDATWIAKVLPLALNGKRPFLDEDIYSFGNVFDDDELLNLIRTGKGLAVSLMTTEGLSFDPPASFVAWNSGRLVPLPSDLRRGKGAGSSKVMPKMQDASKNAERRKVPPGRWAAVSSLPGVRVGDIHEFAEGDEFTFLDNLVLLRCTQGPAEGHVVVLERLDERTSEQFREARRKQAVEEFALPSSAPVVPAGDASKAPAEEPDDARTLSVTKNKRGRRHKHFVDAVDELVEDMYNDWPLKDNVRTLLHILERMASDGLAPVAWCEAYLARKKYADSDRSQHELKNLAKILETSLLYDQLNVTSLAAFEHLSRRFQLILAAHANDSLNPVYAGAEFYGGDDGDELLAPELRRKVLEGMKTQAKVLEVQQKQKELKVPLPRGPKGGPKGGV